MRTKSVSAGTTDPVDNSRRDIGRNSPHRQWYEEFIAFHDGLPSLKLTRVYAKLEPAQEFQSVLAPGLSPDRNALAFSHTSFRNINMAKSSFAVRRTGAKVQA